MIRNSIHTFKSTLSTGLDRVPVNGIIQVIDADITGTNKVGFIQLIDKTAIIPASTIENLLDGTVGEYKDIVEGDNAGRLYDQESKYKVGDIVAYDDGSAPTVYDAFICIVDVPAEPFDSTKWKLLSEDLEYRGRLWDNDKNYRIGDIVSISSSNSIFVASTNNTGSDPLSLIDWREVNDVRYNQGVWDPAITEYPDLNEPGNAVGAVYYITNVGSPVDAGTPGYTYLTGVLAGKKVFDNDKIIWYGDMGVATTPEDDNWLWEPFPRVSGERGGVAYTSTLAYSVGDLVIENWNMYMSLTDNTTQPSLNPIDWQIVDSSVVLPIGVSNQDILEWSTTVPVGWKISQSAFSKLSDTPSTYTASANQKIVVDNGNAIDGTAIIFKKDIVHTIMDTPVTSTHGDMLIWDDGVTSPTLGKAAWVNSQASISVDKDFDASINQTVFDLISPTVTKAVVHINGAMQRSNSFTVAAGVITLGSPTNLNDWVNIVGRS